MDSSPDSSITSPNKILHQPVMVQEVLHYLNPQSGDWIIDATFGRGGYSRAILAATDCRVIAMDRDPEAIAFGKTISAEFDGRLTLHLAKFSEIETVIQQNYPQQKIHGMVMDLGLSSPQLDSQTRGFSFRYDAPLDMRMGGENEAIATAADLVNHASAVQLTEVLTNFGEERYARRIVREILSQRSLAPITRTSELAGIIRRCVPRSKDGLDPATRSFQALRIWVNDELGEIDRALATSAKCLAVGGRLVVVAFHSLEDRRVKQFLVGQNPQRGSGVSRHMPIVPNIEQVNRDSTLGSANSIASTLSRLHFTSVKKPILPSPTEMRQNPRAQSAKLRAAIMTLTEGQEP